MGCEYVDGVFKGKRTISQDDVLLASMGDRDLYLSEVQDMILTDNPNDSINQLNYFVESWIKRTVILTEAEENFPENIDINKLVEDYKSSLLLHNYRQVLIEKKLDTTITIEQERAYYEANKTQFILENKLCQARIAVIPEKAPKMEKFYRNWKKNDTIAIETYVETYATNKMDNTQKWYTTDEFLAFLPHNTFQTSDIKKSKDLQKNHDGFEYFVKIYNVIEKNDAAPISYISDNIKKLIIHQRKTEILNNIEQDLYQQYLKMNRIQDFTKQ